MPVAAVVSRAFQVLSDPDKKSKYDKFGGDPDSRFTPSAGPSGASPFGGFGGGGFPRSAGAGGSMFEEEISPEELFNRFFNGGFGGGGFGPFGTLASHSFFSCLSESPCLRMLSRRSSVCFQHGGRSRFPGTPVWRAATATKTARSQRSGRSRTVWLGNIPVTTPSYPSIRASSALLSFLWLVVSFRSFLQI
jgi:curved DNA-binding protein CbpA